MKFSNKNALLTFSLTSLVGCFGLACQQPATNGNSGVASSNSAVSINTNVVNANPGNSNGSVVSSNGPVIETKEPEQYQATVTLKFETSGDQKMSSPPLRAEVARDGTNRRMEFSLPSGEKFVYLDLGGRQLIVSPTRKQYAELDKQSTGFEVRRFLMPEQIVGQIKNLKGIEQIGEEKFNGRDAVKYRIGAATDTKSQAGTVQTESFILVDKETSLPLLSETNSEAQGNAVNGIKGVRLVTEMSNIKTSVDQTLFQEPTDFAKVPPEQIKQQVDQMLSVTMALIGQLMKNAPQSTSGGNGNFNGNMNPTASPMTSPNQ
jgi:hypothetical protein